MKKCIVLDLDNTLWGGIVGEDGMDALALSLEEPGASFIAFQQAILDHYHRGVLLAINSRNNPEDAWKVIATHPNMILKEKHFAAARINWMDKAENVREIAKELNIGLDSMVFIDDDPTNRALVRAMVPEVDTPELPADPRDYTRFLHSLDYFPKEVVTDEDKMRGNLYVTERLRKEREKKFADKAEFLQSLSLELTLWKDDDSCVPRLSQLTEKTNQFNTVKQPFSEEEIRRFIASPDHAVFHARLQDTFGDHGIIAFALVEKKKAEWQIRSMLMSCRVFGREVEDAFFSAIAEHAKAAGANKVTIGIEESAKNLPAREFVKKYFKDGAYAIGQKSSAPAWIKIINSK
jgi:FkbH-like protein